MKAILFLLFSIVTGIAIAQNVGIGTSSVSRAKLVVSGVGNTNSNTVAIFGTSHGISLQQSWPSIGFNEYKPTIGQIGTAISTGYGMHMTFDYTSGDLSMRRSGQANTGVQFPSNDRFLGFVNGSNTLKLNSEISGGEVEVAKEMYSPQVPNFNLVPLGVIQFDLTQNSLTASNVTGSLLTGFQNFSSSSQLICNLYVSHSIVANYTSFIVVPAYSYGNSSGPFQVVSQEYTDNVTLKFINIQLISTDGVSSGFVKGQLILYGIK